MCSAPLAGAGESCEMPGERREMPFTLLAASGQPSAGAGESSAGAVRGEVGRSAT